MRFPLGNKHFDAGENEKRAQQIQDPIEMINERDTAGNHRAAHHEHAQNAPKQDAMLVFRRHAKAAKISAMTKTLSSERESSMK